MRSILQWRMTTWLIILNALVWVLGQFVFNAPRFVPYGQEYLPNVTARQIAEGVELKGGPGGQLLPPQEVPQRPGIYAYPIVTVPRDASGRPQPNVPVGNLTQIGRQLYIVQGVLDAWGHFSTAKGFFGLEVWRFLTFQFLHVNITHLGFNLLGLWFSGYLVEEFLGSRKRFLAFYLTCGIFGALMYLLLNLTGNVLVFHLGLTGSTKLPFLLFDSVYTPLVGASAGIFGVLMAAAYAAPDEIVDVLGVIPTKMRTAVYGFTLLALANLYFGSKNAGGEAAHIGGAIAGFFFIRRMHLLRDFFDVFGDSREGDRPARPAPASNRPAGDATVRRSRSFFEKLIHPVDRTPAPAEVDRILAKITEQGMESLTRAERLTLLRDSRSKRGH